MVRVPFTTDGGCKVRNYGLAKIHRASVPLRLNLTCVNTFAYDLSAFLADILSLSVKGKCHGVLTSLAKNGDIRPSLMTSNSCGISPLTGPSYFR